MSFINLILNVSSFWIDKSRIWHNRVISDVYQFRHFVKFPVNHAKHILRLWYNMWKITSILKFKYSNSINRFVFTTERRFILSLLLSLYSYFVLSLVGYCFPFCIFFIVMTMLVSWLKILTFTLISFISLYLNKIILGLKSLITKHI